MHIQNDVKESRKKVRECGEGMSAAEEAGSWQQRERVEVTGTCRSNNMYKYT